VVAPAVARQPPAHRTTVPAARERRRHHQYRMGHVDRDVSTTGRRPPDRRSPRADGPGTTGVPGSISSSGRPTGGGRRRPPLPSTLRQARAPAAGQMPSALFATNPDRCPKLLSQRPNAKQIGHRSRRGERRASQSRNSQKILDRAKQGVMIVGCHRPRSGPCPGAGHQCEDATASGDSAAPQVR